MLLYSDLHTYRGVEPAEPGFIMGHEFVGEIVELGSAVKSFKMGDRIVSAFTTSWYVYTLIECLTDDTDTITSGQCYYCKQGFSSRCEKSKLFGCEVLNGGQAQYVS
jgi:threonine dehydrogenase-like Zn-dependent dehydrogenase